jgi:hypothetical protein
MIAAWRAAPRPPAHNSIPWQIVDDRAKFPLPRLARRRRRQSKHQHLSIWLASALLPTFQRSRIDSDPVRNAWRDIRSPSRVLRMIFSSILGKDRRSTRCERRVMRPSRCPRMALTPSMSSSKSFRFFVLTDAMALPFPSSYTTCLPALSFQVECRSQLPLLVRSQIVGFILAVEREQPDYRSLAGARR